MDNALTRQIIGAAMKVHSALGPGLLESAYRTCLGHELQLQRLRVEKEVPIPIVYGRIVIDVGYRADLLVEGEVVVETKALQKTIPLHAAQLLSHLRLSHHRVGLLINFNVRHL